MVINIDFMKKYLISIILFITGLSISTSAQELQWNLNLNYFFDNTEFARSALSNDQTMTGVHFSPELGMKWDENNSIYGGVDLLKKSASKTFADNVKFIAYYQFRNENTLFKAGAFQRGDLLSDYSTAFFQDSIGFYRPIMEGLFLKKGNETGYFKLWMDWTGLQTNTDRETFYLGASAYKQIRGPFFADFQSYMFHFAGMNPYNPDITVCDNLLAQLSVGVKYSNIWVLNNLMASAGVLSGFERDRYDMNNYGTPTGAIFRINADYKGIGTENNLYFGQPHMVLYRRYKNELYWGNPFYRDNYYIESKIFWNLIDTRTVKGQLAAKLHVTEGKLLFEQLFTLRASIGSDQPKPRKTTLWDYFIKKKALPRNNFNL